VEAVYALGGSDDVWLKGVAEAAQPLLDEGFGLATYIHRFSPEKGLELCGLAGAGVPDEILGFLRDWLVHDGVALRKLHWEAGAVTTMAEGSGGTLNSEDSLFAEWFAPAGMRDIFGLRGLNDDSCVTIATPRGYVIERLDPRLRATWSCVAAHLAAGFRLRQALTGASPLDELGDDDAVLSADGSLKHASGRSRPRTARDKLREAASRIDRARGPARMDDEEALALWRGLVDGRWSMVDCFDTDGRRFVVARRNREQVTDPRGLSERESQVATAAALGSSNKMIAYRLGLSKSTVATHLRNAIRKLGLSSRLELVRLFSPV
jgi:DNA-binding CsgD family transcriptional regulator